MKRLLLVTYWFPPRESTGTRRIQGITRYLPGYGWDVTVLTPSLPLLPRTPCRVIETPYPGDVGSRIKRTCTGSGMEPSGSIRLLGPLIGTLRGAVAFPDEQRRWIRHGTRKAIELTREEHFDAILSSCSPFSAHVVASRTSALSGIPWVADFRDPWSMNHDYRYGLRRRIDAWYEKRILRQATLITTVSEPMAAMIESMHRKPARCVMNGFDPAKLVYRPAGVERFVLRYTGRLYRTGHRVPLKLLLEGIRYTRDKVNLHHPLLEIYGPPARWALKMVEETGLGNLVVYRGEVSTEEAVRLQRTACGLVVLDWHDGRTDGVYTGKVFEYMAARRPIMAVGSVHCANSVLRELMERSSAGLYLCTPDSIGEYILSLYRRFERGEQITSGTPVSSLMHYSQERMAEEFNDALEEVSCAG